MSTGPEELVPGDSTINNEDLLFGQIRGNKNWSTSVIFEDKTKVGLSN